jgi:hypothetical protein
VPRKFSKKRCVKMTPKAIETPPVDSLRRPRCLTLSLRSRRPLKRLPVRLLPLSPSINEQLRDAGESMSVAELSVFIETLQSLFVLWSDTNLEV